MTASIGRTIEYCRFNRQPALGELRCLTDDRSNIRNCTTTKGRVGRPFATVYLSENIRCHLQHLLGHMGLCAAFQSQSHYKGLEYFHTVGLNQGAQEDRSVT